MLQRRTALLRLGWMLRPHQISAAGSGSLFSSLPSIRGYASMTRACDGQLGRLPSTALAIQRRSLSWNPLKWGDGSQSGLSAAVLAAEQELPEDGLGHQAELSTLNTDRSSVEILDDVWSWFLTFLDPVEKQVGWMRFIRHEGFFGLDMGTWGMTFVVYGVVLRLLTLIPALYGHRNGLRMGLISPQLNEITARQNKVKDDRSLSSGEKKIVRKGYRRMQKALCRKYGCAQWKSFLPMATTPITISAFIAVRQLTMYESDLELAPFLWVSDLTMPDPTYILPVICSLMFVLNFDLNQQMQRGGRSSSGMYMRWGMRLGSLVGLYFFTSQPAAMFAYWIGLSSAGLMQPLLLRWAPFRRYFDFPDPPQAAQQYITESAPKLSILQSISMSKTEKQKRTMEEAAKRAALLRKTEFKRIDDFELVTDTKERGRG